MTPCFRNPRFTRGAPPMTPADRCSGIMRRIKRRLPAAKIISGRGFLRGSDPRFARRCEKRTLRHGRHFRAGLALRLFRAGCVKLLRPVSHWMRSECISRSSVRVMALCDASHVAGLVTHAAKQATPERSLVFRAPPPRPKRNVKSKKSVSTTMQRRALSHTQTRTQPHAHTHHLYTHTHTHTKTHTHTQTHTHKHTCTKTQTQTHTHTYTHRAKFAEIHPNCSDLILMLSSKKSNGSVRISARSCVAFSQRLL